MQSAIPIHDLVNAGVTFTEQSIAAFLEISAQVMSVAIPSNQLAAPSSAVRLDEVPHLIPTLPIIGGLVFAMNRASCDGMSERSETFHGLRILMIAHAHFAMRQWC